MAMPATTGQLRTRVQDMQIGDFIKCHYNANNTTKTAAGHFYAFAQDTAATEIPLVGLSTVTTMGFFYLVKVDLGLLIADRVVRNTMAWDVLNTAKYIQGRPQERDGSGHDFGFDCTVRSLTGGVVYADANGNVSLTDIGYNAWPTNNEWDKYIENSSKGYAADDDNVWHHKGIFSWVQDTPMNGSWTTNQGSSITASSSNRICRGFESRTDNRNVSFTLSSSSVSHIGFRPVFEYKEV